MTGIDYFILGVVGIGGILGYRDGLFRKILAIVSFIIGLIAATKLMNPLGTIISSSFGFSLEISFTLAFFAVFIVIVILQNVVFKIIGNMSGGLQIVNKIGGVLIGLLQGSLAASLILVMLSLFGIPSESTTKKSPLYKPFLTISPRLFDLTSKVIPESKSFYDELKKGIGNTKPGND